MSIAYDSKIVVSRYEHLHGRLVCYRERQSLLGAECSSWQLGQHATEDGQQARTGRRLPPLGQEGLGQRCSALVWVSEQKGQTGRLLGQRVEMWPNFQHFLHWEFLEEENICSTLRFREKRLMEGKTAKASGGAMVTTTEVADLWSRDSGSGLRSRAERIETPLALRMDS